MRRDLILDSFRPPVRPPAVEWIPQHVRTMPGSEYDGLFDFDLAPHTRGVIEAWDDERIREITLCWATRNMKTSTMIALLIYAAVHTPRPMAFGSCDEPSIDRTIDEQIYPMLEACEDTRPQLLPERLRGKKAIKLQRCRIRKAFGGSKSSVAGYPACYIFVNELDKWPIKRSSEADAVRGFRQRTKGYPYEHKIIQESTPGELQTSRVWAELTAKTTDQRQYWVPCLRCGGFQLLTFDHVKWDKAKNGHSDPLIADETAHYVCALCQKKNFNEDRPEMMRAGRWVSEGQTIDHRGKLRGKPKVESPRVGFGPLSSLYSLLISGWGQIATDFLLCGKDYEKLRDFRNSTLSLPHDRQPKKTEPHELAARLGTDEPIGVVPAWAVFLTRGVDVQAGANVFPWSVHAWGPGGRNALVDTGIWLSLAEAEDHLRRNEPFPHADGGRPLPVALTFIDSGDGHVTEDIYQLCRRLRRVLPCKGSSKSNFPEAYQLSPLDEDEQPTDKRRKILRGGIQLVIVNTNRSQAWIKGVLSGETPREGPFGMSLPAESVLDVELLEELLAEVCIEEPDSNGYPRKIWKKTGCNDRRDTSRYAWTAAMMITNHGKFWNSLPARRRVEEPAQDSAAAVAPRRARKKSLATQGGGREWPDR